MSVKMSWESLHKFSAKHLLPPLIKRYVSVYEMNTEGLFKMKGLIMKCLAPSSITSGVPRCCKKHAYTMLTN